MDVNFGTNHVNELSDPNCVFIYKRLCPEVPSAIWGASIRRFDFMKVILEYCTTHIWVTAAKLVLKQMFFVLHKKKYLVNLLGLQSQKSETILQKYLNVDLMAPMEYIDTLIALQEPHIYIMF